MQPTRGRWQGLGQYEARASARRGSAVQLVQGSQRRMGSAMRERRRTRRKEIKAEEKKQGEKKKKEDAVCPTKSEQGSEAKRARAFLYFATTTTATIRGNQKQSGSSFAHCARPGRWRYSATHSATHTRTVAVAEGGSKEEEQQRALPCARIPLDRL